MSTHTLRGRLVEYQQLCTLDLHALQLDLIRIDHYAPPWSARAHIAFGRGAAARERADAAASALELGRTYAVQAQQAHAIGTTLHLLGDVSAELVDEPAIEGNA